MSKSDNVEAIAEVKRNYRSALRILRSYRGSALEAFSGFFEREPGETQRKALLDFGVKLQHSGSPAHQWAHCRLCGRRDVRSYIIIEDERPAPGEIRCIDCTVAVALARLKEQLKEVDVDQLPTFEAWVAWVLGPPQEEGPVKTPTHERIARWMTQHGY